MQIVYLNGARLHLTWHEMSAQFRHPLFVGMMLALGAIIVFLGPYDHLLRFGALRLTIFYASAFSSFTLLLLCALWVCHHFEWPAYSLLTVGFAGLGATVIGLLTALLLGAPMPSLSDLLLVTGFNLVFSYLGEILHAVFIMPRIIAELRSGQHSEVETIPTIPDQKEKPVAAPTASTPHPQTSSPKQVDSISLFGRQFLLQDIELIEAEEHYVAIVTRDGKQNLLRGRIADAISAMPAQFGAQVHRSYWIASNAVAEFRMDGGSAFVRLKTGRTIPVARGRIPEVRKWCEALQIEA